MSDVFKHADPNMLGNTATVVPAPNPDFAPNGWGAVQTVNKYQPGLGSLARDTSLQETDPRIMTASIYATPVVPGTAFTGPITGIAIWATGSGLPQIAEFDIPVSTDANPIAVPPIGAKMGGTLISVVATSLEIRARHDGNLIPQSQGVGQINVALGNAGGIVLAPNKSALVSASIGAGVKPTSNRTTKTVWLIHNTAGGASAFPANTGAVNAPIPPYAVSFRVMRGSAFEPGAAVASAILVTMNDLSGTAVDGGYNVGAGVICPEIPLSGQEVSVGITNVGAFTIDDLAVIFYLAI